MDLPKLRTVYAVAECSFLSFGWSCLWQEVAKVAIFDHLQAKEEQKTVLLVFRIKRVTFLSLRWSSVKKGRLSQASDGLP
jgi:hypothetical protein